MVWLAGGLAKGARFDDLVRSRRSKLAAAVIIGRDQQPMAQAIKDQAPDLPVTLIDPGAGDQVMARAVRAAGSYAKPGQVVLLAPACASMDQFASYADRGDQFAQQAEQWVHEHEARH